MTRTTARLPHLAAALVASSLVLTACGEDSSDAAGAGSASSSQPSDSTSASAETEHNDADIAFASGMVPHHKGAIEMAQLAAGRAADPRVLDLASRIEAAQGPEIDTLNGWLAEWGAATDSGMDHGSMDHESADSGHMGGMDMAALMDATGAEFDRLFLEEMVVHHRGAVDMAEAELAEGRNSEALAMAETIRDTQVGEIAAMEQLLTELGG
ncbi:Uncharacterized conserved protein, DUF305 family [Blastococcus aurantiacus]|uniref:Uncharacterized conserved protein, DUF305 family n=1 Tax=Blastococcus aurantiacus TaxID=1550231 RepID=A0A1G7JJC1_9ACTN|nr:DUF305 domain-containing protein [Blastococcus aurantiacus]SDF24579.1 Uncharacterized conserved protein, DUF305 family [Blastococcus aurantiacus]